MAWFPSLAALGGSSGKRLVAGPQTIGQLKSGTSRLVDAYPYDYAAILRASSPDSGWLAQPLEDAEKNVRVVIIGAGMSGLLSARELLRAGLNVVLYERNQLEQVDSDWHRYSYGRTHSAVRTLDTDTVCELGAMRFPGKAKVTWEVFGDILGDDTLLQLFPNPGLVPTILCHNGVAHRWMAGSVEAPDLPPQFMTVSADVRNAISGIQGGGSNILDILALLEQPQLSAEDESRILAFWTEMIERFDKLDLGTWLLGHVAQPNGWTPEQLAIFVNVGFGTGGMGSMFSMGFLEMLRIWLWDYLDEYALPPGVGSGMMAHAMLDKLKDEFGPAGKNTFTVHERHEVQELGTFVSHDEASVHAGLLVRNLNDQGAQGHALIPVDADYVIAAIPHTAMLTMMSLASELSYPRNGSRVEIAINGVGHAFHSYFDKSRPSAIYESHIAPLKNAVARLHMMNASKSFYVTPQAPWAQGSILAHSWTRIDNRPVRCLMSEGWTRSSYFIPAIAEDHPGPVSVLLSYTWNLDSIMARSVLGIAPSQENDASGNADRTENPAWFGPGFPPEWWRSYRAWASVLPYVKDTTDPVRTTEYFHSILSDKQSDPNAIGIDWQDQIGATGGFKLDAPGDFSTSNALCNLYLFTQDPAFNSQERDRVYRRIFLSSDSASNYPGWCEGAFMSGMNAAIGVLANINQSKLKPEPAQLLLGNPLATVNRLVPLKPYVRQV
ncbi:flavin monoamine oxidase family protein [Pseudomonas poae]|uniref:Uncharacterized protein n=1 Tax=Pseudomonas poae TaxID=200451 RepID=A0A2S9ELD6_9PSED|nr:FAD-dependent oxidoreductase [Pseudomonas poae]PRA32403.1 hypothetical protein CQZ97_06885 [Pseudomonas poae]PRC16146.1 hypothetical protein CQZ99_16875 [Pseudomonas poae]